MNKPFFTSLYRHFALMMLSAYLTPALLAGQGNDFRFGIDLSPSISWMGTNDNNIDGDGSTLGLKLRVAGEQYFQENYALSGGFGLALGMGGTLAHETGGNFWPNSSLSSPDFNTGDKPLPDGVRLSYQFDYLEFSLGLKMRTSEMGAFRYFVEIPTFTLGLLTKARGGIEGDGVSTEKERIGKDVRNVALSWGLGPGLEYELEGGLTLIAGLAFQQTINDVTKNKGYKAFEVGGTPTEPEYERRTEDSRSRIGSITIRLGVAF